MTTIVEIDGIGEIEFPDSMSQAQISTEVQRIAGGASGRNAAMQPNMAVDLSRGRMTQDQIASNTPGPLATGIESGMRRFTDNFLNIIPAAGEMLATGAGAVRTLPGSAARLVTGEDQDFMERLRANAEEERGRFPANMMIAGPSATSNDLEAAAQTAKDVITGNADIPVPDLFEARRGELVDQQIAARGENPASANLGDMAGDAVTLATMRAPAVRGSRNARVAAAAAPVKAAPLSPGVRKQIDQVVNSGIVSGLRRGGLKITEAGLDGALLAAMNDDDPLTNAALAAGAQTIGSGALTAGKGILGGKGRNFVIALGATTGLIQMFKEATPGNRDRILESGESATRKILASLALGAVAGMVGSGRVRGDMANNMPVIADAITAIPRGAVISLLSDIATEEEAGERTVETVIGKMAADPDYFGPAAKRRIERAWRSEKLSVREEIDKLKTDRRFRRRLDALTNVTE